MPTEKQLSDVLSEFARTMVTDFPIQAILDHFVERIVEIMPVTGAGVSLTSPTGEPRYVAASDADALRFERLQAELCEGPCVRAFCDDSPVSVPVLLDDPRFPKFGERAAAAGIAAVFAFPLRHGEGEVLGALDLYRDAAGPLADEDMFTASTLADVAAAYILNAQARDDLREASARSSTSALHDPLTGLPNRTLFGQRLDHAMLRTRRSGRPLAVMFADLDRFKHINDLFGHQVGDELLQAVAERMTSLLRPGDTLARFGGDEFVILCEDLESPTAVVDLADRISSGMTRPFQLRNHELVVTASVGMVYSGEGDEISEQIMRDADTAMYRAKKAGGARHHVLDLRERERADQRVVLARDLHGLMARDELRAPTSRSWPPPTRGSSASRPSPGGTIRCEVWCPPACSSRWPNGRA